MRVLGRPADTALASTGTRAPRGTAPRGTAPRVDRLTGVAAGLWAASVTWWSVELGRVDLAHLSQAGLITALPAGFFAATALLAASFALTLYRPSPNRLLLVVELASAVLMLYGTAPIVEPIARFATGWLHAGFTDHVAATGGLLPRLDARFNWPGFFTAVALVERAARVPTTIDLLRFAPLYFEIGYGIGIYAIATNLTRSPRAPWCAVWLFYLMNWIGQDYFSPQALAYILAIGFLAIVLRRWPAVASPAFEDPPAIVEWSARPQPTHPGTLVAFALVLFAAMVVSHEITAPIVLVWATVLLAFRAPRRIALALAMLVIFLGWLSYGAEPYWSGHLSALFGPFGNLSRSLGTSITKRVGGSVAHIRVEEARLAFTGTFFVLAGVGLWRWWRQRRATWLLVALTFAPFSTLFAQNYGGEVLLRAVLFSLPFLAPLAAAAFLPGARRASWRSAVALALVSCAMAPLFMLARYGNELGDYESPATYQALQYLYTHAPKGSAFVPLLSEVPWQYRDITEFTYDSTSNTPLDYAQANALLSVPGPGAFLFISRDQIAYAELDENYTPAWAYAIAHRLIQTGRFRLIYHNADAEIIARSPERLVR